MSIETVKVVPGRDVNACAPLPPIGSQSDTLKSRVTRLLRERDTLLIAHYYTPGEIQELALSTGGCVADSLEMARFGQKQDASTLAVAGVRFMGETAKILSPDKRVLMPTLEATCSLDLGCPPDEFSAFCDAHPERTVVVYANTSAAVKARADWVVTSSIALEVVDYLDQRGEKILWAPDKYLGSYVQRQTGADMVLWEGSCVVHEEFKARGIEELQRVYPDATVLAHPESPAAVVALADVVGSTSRLIRAARELPNTYFIVATDKGIFHTMRRESPHKVFIEAPTAGEGATCRSCALCPWMAMNSLERLFLTISRGDNEIQLDPDVCEQALKPLQKMVSFVGDRA